MTARIRQFIRNEDGATAVEYGLIAALICVVIISAVSAVGSAIETQFDRIATAIGAPTP